MCNANIHHICLSHVASVMTYVNTEGGDAHKCATPTFITLFSLMHADTLMNYVNNEGGDAHKCATPTFIIYVYRMLLL